MFAPKEPQQLFVWLYVENDIDPNRSKWGCVRAEGVIEELLRLNLINHCYLVDHAEYELQLQ